MNFREGTKRAYLALCCVISIAIVGTGVGTLPDKSTLEYESVNPVLSAAKRAFLTQGDGDRYGAYRGWSDNDIISEYCPSNSMNPAMKYTCAENSTDDWSLLKRRLSHGGKTLLFLLGFLVLAAVVLRTASWIGNGFTQAGQHSGK